MPRKKKETDAAKEVGSIAETEKEDILQTDLESEISNTTDEDHNHEEAEDKASHQTEIENSLEAAGDDSLVNENSQTDIEKNRMTSPGRSEGALDDNLSQTDMENTNNNQPEPSPTSKLTDGDMIDQTDIDNFADNAGQAVEPEGTIMNSSILSQSGGEAENSRKGSNVHGRDTLKANSSTRPTSRVLTIDEHLSVETEVEKAKNDYLDLLESQKSGRILSGTIQGVERGENVQGISYAVIYHGDYKVIIPADEAVTPPEDFRGQRPEDVMHYLITKRLGAEVDYVVKGIDNEAGVAVASRLEAMRTKRKEYYFGSDRNGNNIIYSGINAEARIVSVIRAGIFVDLFGIEVYIPLKELSYQRWMDAQVYFQPGQRIIVKILSVDRSDKNNIKVEASVKQASENPYEKALKRYSVGNRYVGTVSMVDTNGVFVALDGGVDCLCQYPKRGRPPRGSRVTVRILGINEESNRIWGAITHIAAAR